MNARRAIVFVAFVVVAGCRTTQVRQPAARSGSEEQKPVNAVSAVDVVQRQLDAYNAQDVEAFVATYSDDVVITAGSKGEVLLQGKDALRKRYAGMFERFPRNRCRIAERRTEGDSVVLDHEIITGRGPDKPDPWDVGWVRYEVEGGLIRRVELP